MTIDLDNNLDNDKTISGIIWQNLKNINRWLTDSPTWIQEMLAHLKIIKLFQHITKVSKTPKDLNI